VTCFSAGRPVVVLEEVAAAQAALVAALEAATPPGVPILVEVPMRVRPMRGERPMPVRRLRLRLRGRQA
jgi:hypothetical protein